jgi:hypothetical protein
VPLGFSPLHSGEPVQEVSTTLPLLDSAGAKLLNLEEVICDQLETEGRVLAEKVVEHVLTYFQSQDPVVSLNPVLLIPVPGIQEVVSNGV